MDKIKSCLQQGVVDAGAFHIAGRTERDIVSIPPGADVMVRALDDLKCFLSSNTAALLPLRNR